MFYREIETNIKTHAYRKVNNASELRGKDRHIPGQGRQTPKGKKTELRQPGDIYIHTHSHVYQHSSTVSIVKGSLAPEDTKRSLTTSELLYHMLQNAWCRRAHTLEPFLFLEFSRVLFQCLSFVM